MFAATMQQQQMQQDEGRRARKKSPLSELMERLAYQLRNAEWTPTQEDLDAVVKCKNEVVVSSIKYPLFFGVVAGSVSYRLKVLTRAFNIAVASAFGLEYGRRKAEYTCIKHFISLEHSPIKATLVEILQRDFPDHPLLQGVAQRDSSRVGGEEASEFKFPSDRQEHGFPAAPRGLSTLAERPAEYGPDDQQPGDKSRHMISRRELRRERSEPEKSQAVVDATDVLVDPFSLGVWSDGDEPGNMRQQETQTSTRREWRRSRMTREQKREHMSRLREQHLKDQHQQQQQPPHGHPHSMS